MPPDRRKKKRIRLTRGLIARFGTIGAIVLDISDAGARIEHFNPLDVRKKAVFRFDWQQKSIEATAEVRSSRIHRFESGAEATTVYQSGLCFTDYAADSASRLRDLASTIVARSLAEQVANARGLGPVIERNMPVFRSGGVVASGLEPNQESAGRLIPAAEVAIDRGYIRCTLIGGVRFVEEWSRTPDPPQQGFTVSASEPEEHADQLCETFLKGSEDDRQLILLLAQLSA